MYETVQVLHSYWAYLALLILVFATGNALVKFFGNKKFYDKDLRIALFALIVSHIQLLLGLIVYVVSPLGLKMIQIAGMGGMNAAQRQMAVEHPFVGTLAIVFITIGFSKHKKKLTAKKKFKTLSIFYLIGLILILSRIPWSSWLG